VPVEFGIWRIDGGLRKVPFVKLGDESRLEDILVRDVSILGLDVMVVGRQVATSYGKRIDLLAIDAGGDLYAIELKRDRTPREVVAQLLDYGSWVKDLGHEDVSALFSEHHHSARLEEDFENRFGDVLPDALNQEHHLVIVASELDNSTERIVLYLSGEFSVPVSVLFFRYYVDGDREYLARTWLNAPTSAEAATAMQGKAKTREPWNGQDFYVTCGEGPHRNWDDEIKYGYISAGGGKKYTSPLNQLFVGCRIFVYIPGTGYVGVGTVTDTAQPVTEFTIDVDGERKTLLELPLKAPSLSEYTEADNMEYAVRVDWIRTLPRDQAIKEKGLFANQNSACKLRNGFTLERLTERFDLDS
jgi:Endonuclease NucS